MNTQRTLAVLAVAVVCVGGFVPGHADDEQTVVRKVRITQPYIEQGAAPSTLKVWAPDSDDLEPFREGHYDIALVLLATPMNACNDLSDCAEAVEQACEAIGSSGSAVELDKKTCTGKCDNGSGVDVACSHP